MASAHGCQARQREEERSTPIFCYDGRVGMAVRRIRMGGAARGDRVWRRVGRAWHCQKRP
eukprot:6514234-Prymnesium_polylepis.2